MIADRLFEITIIPGTVYTCIRAPHLLLNQGPMLSCYTTDVKAPWSIVFTFGQILD